MAKKIKSFTKMLAITATPVVSVQSVAEAKASLDIFFKQAGKIINTTGFNGKNDRLVHLAFPEFMFAWDGKYRNENPLDRFDLLSKGAEATIFTREAAAELQSWTQDSVKQLSLLLGVQLSVNLNLIRQAVDVERSPAFDTDPQVTAASTGEMEIHVGKPIIENTTTFINTGCIFEVPKELASTADGISKTVPKESEGRQNDVMLLTKLGIRHFFTVATCLDLINKDQQNSDLTVASSSGISEINPTGRSVVINADNRSENRGTFVNVNGVLVKQPEMEVGHAGRDLCYYSVVDIPSNTGSKDSYAVAGELPQRLLENKSDPSKVALPNVADKIKAEAGELKGKK